MKISASTWMTNSRLDRRVATRPTLKGYLETCDTQGATNGQRRFKVHEFLTAQQIQGYFSRTAAKLRHATAPQQSEGDTDDRDFQAAHEEEAYLSVRASIIEECQLVHPIVYETHNICDLYATNRLSKLSVAQLRLICSHFNMDMEGQPSRRKAPYISYISDLVGSCSCTKV